MPLLETCSVPEAGAALGLRPPSVRTRIRARQLVGVRIGRAWRVTVASVNALLAGPTSCSQGNPPTAGSPEPIHPAPSPPPVLQANPAGSPIFTADDDWLLTYANELTHHADPRVALLAAKVIMLHRDLAGCQAVKPAPLPLRKVTEAECAAIWGTSSGGSTLF